MNKDQQWLQSLFYYVTDSEYCDVERLWHDDTYPWYAEILYQFVTAYPHIT